MIMPYYQYTVVKSNPTSCSVTPGAHTNGGAILANYNFKHGFSLAVRPEYIKSSGSVATDEANLLGYGPGTGAFSFTVTPTWVKDAFFLRGDVSIVHVTNFVAGSRCWIRNPGRMQHQPGSRRHRSRLHVLRLGEPPEAGEARRGGGSPADGFWGIGFV